MEQPGISGDDIWVSATEIREPCQVRNEAALSESFCVPEGCLDRANCTGNAVDNCSKPDARF